jgi:anthranilate/para-aminobenzoate synthase component I
VVRTELFDATDTAALGILDQPADRVVLLPFDLGLACEPSIRRQPPQDPTPGPPVVVVTLDPNAKSMQEHGFRSFRTGLLRPDWSREGYTRAVSEALALIAAGDCYQVNLSHRLSTDFAGCARALHARLQSAARPEHGGFLCWDQGPTRHAVVSLSPELFLTYDAATRTVRTKPMKGTRPLASDPNELREAAKDTAELNMIVDLMRNDLGRVADPGSVRVTRPRDIDPHAAVWQATATVEARLRADRCVSDLFRAAFPPGSVTGAPKVRASQIIRLLEPHARGPYCGSLVRLRPDGSLTASVLIRTAHLLGTPDPDNPHGFLQARLHFPVGAGIVADSDPEAEWRETLDKARSLADALGQSLPGTGSGPP